MAAHVETAAAVSKNAESVEKKNLIEALIPGRGVCWRPGITVKATVRIKPQTAMFLLLLLEQNVKVKSGSH